MMPAPPPPAEGETSQRRFDFLMVGVMLALVVVLIASLVTYAHIHDERQAATAVKADVLQSYLAYYSALQQAYQQLSPDPLKPYETSSGLAQELPLIESAYPSQYRITATHDPQVVVYAGGKSASVDDLVSRHIVSIGVSTSVVPNAGTSDVIHESIAMQKQRDRWLVSSALAFGAGQPEPNAGLALSYAADPSAGRLNSSLRKDVTRAYSAFWQARDSVFAGANLSVLSATEESAELMNSRSAIEADRAKDIEFHLHVQHNFRLAMQNASTVWIYDTIWLTSSQMRPSTGASVGPQMSQCVRQEFRLKKVGSKWKVDFDVLDQ